jgi:hypothetical protein
MLTIYTPSVLERMSQICLNSDVSRCYLGRGEYKVFSLLIYTQLRSIGPVFWHVKIVSIDKLANFIAIYQMACHLLNFRTYFSSTRRPYIMVSIHPILAMHLYFHSTAHHDSFIHWTSTLKSCFLNVGCFAPYGRLLFFKWMELASLQIPSTFYVLGNYGCGLPQEQWSLPRNSTRRRCR